MHIFICMCVSKCMSMYSIYTADGMCSPADPLSF